MDRRKIFAGISNNRDLTLILNIKGFLISSLLLKRGFLFYAH
jgi:hypothetical protein